MNDSVYQFVDRVKREIDHGHPEIACFPEVATQLIRELDSEQVAVHDIAKVVSSEPALALRVIGMANSAAYRSGGRAMTDVRMAITRVGLRALRAVILAFAVMKIRESPPLRLVQHRIGDVWQQSTLTAALCHLIALELRVEGIRHDHEAAMLAGLMQGVGKIFVFAEAAFRGELEDDPSALDDIVRAWHAPAAAKLLAQWGLGKPVIDAVVGHESADQAIREKSNLTDLLHAAALFAEMRESPQELARHVAASRACQRLELWRLNPEHLLAQLANESDSLESVLR